MESVNDNRAGERSQGMSHGDHMNGSTFNSGGNPGNMNSTPIMTTVQGIDYIHPLFLSPSDVSGLNLLPFQLIGTENYVIWSRSI